MRKVLFYGAISLDGYLADKQNNLDWLLNSDLQGKSTYEDFISHVDTLVMGHNTYKETKKILDGEPFYPEQRIFVFSHSQTSLVDATVVKGDVAKFINQQKELAGQDIWIVGGGPIVQPLIEADLIDEWQIQIAPFLLGNGKRLFEPGDYFKKLKLVNTTNLGELTELHFKK